MSRKQLKLSDTTKAPPFRGGLDWDEIRRKYHDRLREERARGIDTEEHRIELDMTDQQREDYLLGKKVKQDKADNERKEKRSRAGKGEGGAGGQRKGPRSEAQVEEFIRLYTEENMPPGKIAEKLHASPTTVIRWLRDRGVYDRNKFRKQPPIGHHGGGLKRSDRCGEGHDLTLPGASRERFKKQPDGSLRPNGRECVLCCRERARQAWANSRPGVEMCLCGHAKSLHGSEGEGFACYKNRCGCRKYHQRQEGE